MRSRQRIFCACAPGLEPVLAAELDSLGLSARAVPGGALAEGEDAAAWACLAPDPTAPVSLHQRAPTSIRSGGVSISLP